MKALDNKNVLATHIDERPSLVFAILKFVFFVDAQRSFELGTDVLTKFVTALQCEYGESIIDHVPVRFALPKSSCKRWMSSSPRYAPRWTSMNTRVSAPTFSMR